MLTVSKTVRHRAIRICLAYDAHSWVDQRLLGWCVELKLAGIFSDHMVLQRERPVPVRDGPTKAESSRFGLRAKLSRQR